MCARVRECACARVRAFYTVCACVRACAHMRAHPVVRMTLSLFAQYEFTTMMADLGGTFGLAAGISATLVLPPQDSDSRRHPL